MFAQNRLSQSLSHNHSLPISHPSHPGMGNWTLNYSYITNSDALHIEFLTFESYIVFRERGCF
jgi:hypothetical protein